MLFCLYIGNVIPLSCVFGVLWCPHTAFFLLFKTPTEMGFLYSFGKEILSALKLRQHYPHAQNELAEFGENIYFQLCLRINFPVLLLLFYFFVPYPATVDIDL